MVKFNNYLFYLNEEDNKDYNNPDDWHTHRKLPDKDPKNGSWKVNYKSGSYKKWAKENGFIDKVREKDKNQHKEKRERLKELYKSGISKNPKDRTPDEQKAIDLIDNVKNSKKEGTKLNSDFKKTIKSNIASAVIKNNRGNSSASRIAIRDAFKQLPNFNITSSQIKALENLPKNSSDYTDNQKKLIEKLKNNYDKFTGIFSDLEQKGLITKSDKDEAISNICKNTDLGKIFDKIINKKEDVKVDDTPKKEEKPIEKKEKEEKPVDKQDKKELEKINERKIYDPLKDEPLKFDEIKISTSDEAEKILKERCGLKNVRLDGATDQQFLTEIVNSVIKMHDNFPEVFDKNFGGFNNLYTYEGIRNIDLEKINEEYKNGEYSKEVESLFKDFDDGNMKFTNLIRDITFLRNKESDFNNDGKESGYVSNHRAIIYGIECYLLRTFTDLEKYRERFNKVMDEQNRTDLYEFNLSLYDKKGRFLPMFKFNEYEWFGCTFNKEDFIKYLRNQDKKVFHGKFFKGITDDEIYNDMKEFVKSAIAKEVKTDKEIDVQKKYFDYSGVDNAWAYANSRNKRIVITPKCYRNIKQYKDGVERSIVSKFHCSGSRYPFAATIIHEMGHSLDYTYANLTSLGTFFYHVTGCNIFKNIHIIDKGKGENNSGVSNYGRTNELEMFAETISAYFENPEGYAKSATMKSIMNSFFKLHNFVQEKMKSPEFLEIAKKSEELKNLGRTNTGHLDNKAYKEIENKRILLSSEIEQYADGIKKELKNKFGDIYEYKN